MLREGKLAAGEAMTDRAATSEATPHRYTRLMSGGHRRPAFGGLGSERGSGRAQDGERVVAGRLGGGWGTRGTKSHTDTLREGCEPLLPRRACTSILRDGALAI